MVLLTKELEQDMKNTYVELVEKWLKDKNSVTQEELIANREAAAVASAASTAYVVYVVYTAAYAAAAASADAAYASAAAYWVKQYHDMTA